MTLAEKAEKEAEVKHEEKVVNQLNATKAKAVEQEDEDSSSCIVNEIKMKLVWAECPK